MLFSGGWGKMIHEKNLKQKISWHCPFKHVLMLKNCRLEQGAKKQLIKKN